MHPWDFNISYIIVTTGVLLAYHTCIPLMCLEYRRVPNELLDDFRFSEMRSLLLLVPLLVVARSEGDCDAVRLRREHNACARQWVLFTFLIIETIIFINNINHDCNHRFQSFCRQSLRNLLDCNEAWGCCQPTFQVVASHLILMMIFVFMLLLVTLRRGSRSINFRGRKTCNYLTDSVEV